MNPSQLRTFRGEDLELTPTITDCHLPLGPSFSSDSVQSPTRDGEDEQGNKRLRKVHMPCSHNCQDLDHQFHNLNVDCTNPGVLTVDCCL